ncbi:PLP-dependent transferase [Neolentinus lepideus HHB14362 ss-1]|uniref:PLP-dependent transferase n=1 Tax=Neolentinus lepideus HHB14362 ss-1 TaxID=1314782 RepID=A0A165QUV5_9AGAM|nr:PLP-dependent transferase [Neolentinus lepideus HHB14362 ss-1]
MSRVITSFNEGHERVGSWFLGPKAENLDYFTKFFQIITEGMKNGRLQFGPDDAVSITNDIRTSQAFSDNMADLEDLVQKLSTFMSQHSVPFYSPRYMAHMSYETSLPATLGYMLGLFYNQNNVGSIWYFATVEGSPLTTLLEWEVGQQLCEVLGYKRYPRDAEWNPHYKRSKDREPYGWGHITCDGSVANLESMWVARNIKYYPLALRDAMTEEKVVWQNGKSIQMPPPLAFAYDTFIVQPLVGPAKLFKNCSVWELLNLKPDTILGLPEQLTEQFGVSSEFLEQALTPYSVQTVGKDTYIQKYGLSQPAYFISRTKHYSWPKGAAISGIGSENLIEVDVDLAARMDTQNLKQWLDKCLEEKRSVYCVVSIMGSTEHGAVDPLSEIVRLKYEYEGKGLSFMVHADAAWGGYFSSMMRSLKEPRTGDPYNQYVGTIPLSDYTNEQMNMLRLADSITLDPHKSGYVPYPAGGLCYRDERFRYLVTWTSPYLDGQQGGVDSIGVYGLEGSKPGASAVATFMSNEIIGLSPQQGGYHTLLGEAMWTASKASLMYCHWVTMDTGSDGFKTIPLQMLPAEKDGGDIEGQKEIIRSTILNRPNLELVEDHDAYSLLRQLGSDLMINTFACNFRNGHDLNTNVEEANYFNKRIYEKLSILKPTDDIHDREVIIMATSLSQKSYGACLKNFKKRMGLEGDEDLYVLANVCMSPFPTAGNFIGELADAFQNVAQEISADCRWRTTISDDHHTFLLQGTDPAYLVYLPMFQAANAKKQAIVKATLPESIHQLYAKAHADDPGKFFTLTTAGRVTLDSILRNGNSFDAYLDEGYSDLNRPRSHLSSMFTVSDLKVLQENSLDRVHLHSEYPTYMPFYLYGTPQHAHLDHVLLRAPNVQISASNVQLHFGSAQDAVHERLGAGLVVVMKDVLEYAMQPFNSGHRPDAFEPHSLPHTFAAEVYEPAVGGIHGHDYSARLGQKVGDGSITVNERIYIDYDCLNADPTDPAISGPRTIMNRFDLEKARLCHPYQRKMANRREWRHALFDHLKRSPNRDVRNPYGHSGPNPRDGEHPMHGEHQMRDGHQGGNEHSAHCGHHGPGGYGF